MSTASLSQSEFGVLNILDAIYPNIKQYDWFQYMIPVISTPLVYSHTLLYLCNVFSFLKHLDQRVTAFHPDHSQESLPTPSPRVEWLSQADVLVHSRALTSQQAHIRPLPSHILFFRNETLNILIPTHRNSV